LLIYQEAFPVVVLLSPGKKVCVAAPPKTIRYSLLAIAVWLDE
jgi:hypothetical protein